jgi:hypothetical protein
LFWFYNKIREQYTYNTIPKEHLDYVKESKIPLTTKKNNDDVWMHKYNTVKEIYLKTGKIPKHTGGNNDYGKWVRR